jgi:threonine synthase
VPPAAEPLFDLACAGCGAAYPAAGFPAVCPLCGGCWRHGEGFAWRPPAGDLAGRGAAGDADAGGDGGGDGGSLRRWAAALGLAAEELPQRSLASPPRLYVAAAGPAGGGARGAGRGSAGAAGGEVWICQQGSAPSGSHKERGAEVMAAAARRRGVGELFLDSSGNAGIAVARAAAARGIRCTVLVPETTAAVKVQRIRAAGADVEVVPGDRDATHDAAQEWRRRLPYAAPFFQPSFLAGIATLAWELAQGFAGLQTSRAKTPVAGPLASPAPAPSQAGDTAHGSLPGRETRLLPEHWLLPAGNGPLLLGLGLGLACLERAGILDRLPALHAVQLEGYAALAPEGPGRARPGAPTAAGIAIAHPPRRADMLSAIAATGGDVTQVTEEQIAAARHELAAQGWITDPTGATAFAGYRRRGDLHGKRCLVIVTSREPPPS